jgi:hypothetical protein
VLKVNSNQELKKVQRKKLYRKLDAIGWGLFFIWIGIALLADVGWGIGLMGIGLLILCSVAAKKYLIDGGRRENFKDDLLTGGVK